MGGCIIVRWHFSKHQVSFSLFGRFTEPKPCLAFSLSILVSGLPARIARCILSLGIKTYLHVPFAGNKVYCAGRNNYGQLGLGTTATATRFTLVAKHQRAKIRSGPLTASTVHKDPSRLEDEPPIADQLFGACW